MKIKDTFLLREVAGETVVIPAGETQNLNFMITLNGTGAFLWKNLLENTTTDALVDALLGEYDVDRDAAKAHVETFVGKLNDYGILEQ